MYKRTPSACNKYQKCTSYHFELILNNEYKKYKKGGKVSMKIRKGDNVQVLSGNDKGKTGEVLEVIPATNKVIVKGVNVRKKTR